MDGHLRSRSTLLVPTAPEHVPALRSLEIADEVAFRWRHAGAHPDPASYVNAFWIDLHFSFLVFSTGDNTRPRGLVTCYHADHQNGHCRIAATRFGKAGASLIVARGILMSIDYAFRGWKFRKVYLEVPEYNLKQFGSAVGKIFDSEAVLSEYVYFDERYWDMHFLAVSRESWRQNREWLGPFIEG